MSNLASRLAASESASSTILAKDRTLSCDTPAKRDSTTTHL